MIQLTPVTNSSQITAHGYDAVSQTLAVTFKSGGTYHYKGVPPEVAQAFASADSIGKFLYAEIRGKFPHERMPDEGDEDGPIETKDGARIDPRAAWALPHSSSAA